MNLVPVVRRDGNPHGTFVPFTIVEECSTDRANQRIDQVRQLGCRAGRMGAPNTWENGRIENAGHQEI